MAEATTGAAAKDAAKQAASSRSPRTPSGNSNTTRARNGYVMPIVHARIPESAVDLGFWGALGVSAALGVVDLPVAVLLGGAVIVARRQVRR